MSNRDSFHNLDADTKAAMHDRLDEAEEKATCRGCKRELIGEPYYMGGGAYHPKTKERCKVNFYGGYVCSPECDKRASLELERTMPGHTANQTSLSCQALDHWKKNWQ